MQEDVGKMHFLYNIIRYDKKKKNEQIENIFKRVCDNY